MTELVNCHPFAKIDSEINIVPKGHGKSCLKFPFRVSWRESRCSQKAEKLAIDLLAVLSTLCSHTFAVHSLFVPHNVSKCEIMYQWEKEDYISSLQTRFQILLV